MKKNSLEDFVGFLFAISRQRNNEKKTVKKATDEHIRKTCW